MEKKVTQTISNNRKAYYNFEISDKYIAGLRLTGTEIKSIRDSKCSIKEAYCYINNEEIWIRGMYIAKYEFGSDNNHEEVYDRRVLLTKKEINKIQKKVEEKGFTLIPLRILLVNGWAKIEVGIGKGKREFDKKNAIKEREDRISIKRDLNMNI